jgi:hypothetical protein
MKPNIPKNYEALKELIQDIMEPCDDPSIAIVELHKLYYPEWEYVQKLEGFHNVSRELDEFIFECFKEQFGQQAMFLWMNYGFGFDENLKGAEYKRAGIIFKEGRKAA